MEVMEVSGATRSIHSSFDPWQRENGREKESDDSKRTICQSYDGEKFIKGESGNGKAYGERKNRRRGNTGMRSITRIGG
jgi:hypothetical protein